MLLLHLLQVLQNLLAHLLHSEAPRGRRSQLLHHLVKLLRHRTQTQALRSQEKLAGAAGAAAAAAAD